ncbi:MAG: hypothetical protein M3Y86_04510 [Verrucomicrobiota bacterium]|nr:hypothetical protein [Verrucomicrobiota bacterium]
MSVTELLQQIDALPPAEMEIVRLHLLKNGEAGKAEDGLEYIDAGEARVLGEKIMSENAGLFRRLAK